MFDELLELFERDGSKRRSDQPRRGGIRGLLDRVRGGGGDNHHDDDDYRRTPTGGERDGDYDHDDDDPRDGRGRRRRDNDAFDFGDD